MNPIVLRQQGPRFQPRAYKAVTWCGLDSPALVCVPVPAKRSDLITRFHIYIDEEVLKFIPRTVKKLTTSSSATGFVVLVVRHTATPGSGYGTAQTGL